MGKGYPLLLTKYSLTEAEYVAAMKHVSRPKLATILGWIGLLSLSGIIFLFFSWNKACPNPYAALWIGLGAITYFVLGMSGLAYLGVPGSARRDFHAIPAIRLETSFDVEQDEYWASAGCRGLRLEDHVMWLKSRGGIFLFTHRRIFHFVPFRLEKHGVNFDLLVGSLEQRLGPAGRVKAGGHSQSSRIGSLVKGVLVWAVTAFMIVVLYNLFFARR